MENKYNSVIESIEIIIGNMKENVNDYRSSLENEELHIIGVDKVTVENEIKKLENEIALHYEAIEDLKNIK